MDFIRSVAGMQRRALSWLRQEAPVGLVPTMGYLHAGHLALVKRARGLVGSGGRVVLSIYVNPAQFGPGEDFSKYPRDLVRDRELCRRAGVDVLFAPSDDQMYPAGGGQSFSTHVLEEALSKPMEGRARPGHFRGVTTVVAKLFHIVLPRVAVFGAKDFQQAAVVRRMVRDLNFPVQIVVAPTVREPGGLALSSRNKHLSADERREAVVLWEAIQWARNTVRKAPQRVSASALRQRLIQRIEGQTAARVDYVEVFHPATLEPVKRAGPGTHLALAVYLGATRLIDNARL